jgi:hypothetical protein
VVITMTSGSTPRASAWAPLLAVLCPELCGEPQGFIG